MDPFADFKAAQRKGWAFFAPLEAITTIPAAKLVAFARVKQGQRVLDVGDRKSTRLNSSHRH